MLNIKFYILAIFLKINSSLKSLILILFQKFYQYFLIIDKIYRFLEIYRLINNFFSSVIEKFAVLYIYVIYVFINLSFAYI